ncbi:MAG: ATP synthase F1 subunit gamma [Oscillospiraceae bacterium]|nr:ATP synthase F1 subunit gamma [Oscillospiraceae bacterium]
MPGTNEIRRHMAAVEQTQKITGAMEMISSNRMRQVMGHIDQNRLYFANIRRMMKELLTSPHETTHPCFLERPRSHNTFLVISGDKSLCGAHNANVLNYTLARLKETPGSALITLGHTAEDFFIAHGIIPDIALLGIVHDPTLAKAREVASELTRLYEDELTDDIRIIYTSFYGDSKGKPVEFRLLPIILHDYDDVSDAESLVEILYHPSPQTVLDMLVPQYTIGLLFGVLVQAYASEHYARMNAMHTSTKNASEMLDGLRTKHNLARQSAITNEMSITAHPQL